MQGIVPWQDSQEYDRTVPNSSNLTKNHYFVTVKYMTFDC